VDEKKSLKISWYILLASMSVLTVLFFFDIKFMVAGLNIIEWDMLAGGIWIFGKLFVISLRASWGILIILFTVIFLPLILVGLLVAGILSVAFPLLLVLGAITVFASKR